MLNKFKQNHRLQEKYIFLDIMVELILVTHLDNEDDNKIKLSFHFI